MCLEKVDEKHFPYPQEYQQVLNITNLLVRKTEMVLSSHLASWSALRPTRTLEPLFRVKMPLVILTWNVSSSFPWPSPTPVKRTKKKVTGGFWLPWWFVFVGWFLLLSISAVSTYFTLLYSFQYGKDKSIKWVLSLGLSLFQSIFVLQPLKVKDVKALTFHIDPHKKSAFSPKSKRRTWCLRSWRYWRMISSASSTPVHHEVDLVWFAGDWCCCCFCPVAETCSCGGDWRGWASAVR